VTYWACKKFVLALAMVALGCILSFGQNTIQELRAHAERGDPEAQNSLGLRYVMGDGVVQDKEAARYWFQQSASQGHAKGQYNLGVMYGSGLGVNKDHKQAVRWYRKAAYQKLDAAEYNLTNDGFMFSNGGGKKEQTNK
jgi:TPR repeat protein